MGCTGGEQEQEQEEEEEEEEEQEQKQEQEEEEDKKEEEEIKEVKGVEDRDGILDGRIIQKEPCWSKIGLLSRNILCHSIWSKALVVGNYSFHIFLTCKFHTF